MEFSSTLSYSSSLVYSFSSSSMSMSSSVDISSADTSSSCSLWIDDCASPCLVVGCFSWFFIVIIEFILLDLGGWHFFYQYQYQFFWLVIFCFLFQFVESSSMITIPSPFDKSVFLSSNLLKPIISSLISSFTTP